MTVHGSRGNTSKDKLRRAISFRYCGDDIRYFDRPGAFVQLYLETPLKDGQALFSKDYPIVWPRPYPEALLSDLFKKKRDNKMDVSTLLHPDRPTPRLRPIEAFLHFQRLLKGKEDIEHAFHVSDALMGKSLVNDLTRFANTQNGATRIAERKYLPPLLDDHTSLKHLPADTVGRAYLNFMAQENFTAAGLVELYETFFEDKKCLTMLLSGTLCRARYYVE